MISSFRCMDSMPCCGCGKESMIGIIVTQEDVGFTNYLCRQCLANLSCIATQALVEHFTIDELTEPTMKVGDVIDKQN